MRRGAVSEVAPSQRRAMLMPVMDVGHVAVLMPRFIVLVHMGMRLAGCYIMLVFMMSVIVRMCMLMDGLSMDV